MNRPLSAGLTDESDKALPLERNIELFFYGETMKALRALSILMLALGTFFYSMNTLAQARQSKQKLRVLFVGGTDPDKDPARIEDFRQFLAQHFTSVKAVKDTDFTAPLTNDADVVVVDGKISKKLPQQLQKPMVLLGYDWAPISIAEDRGYKLMNSCRSLGEELHTVRTTHPIFLGPLPVSPTLIDKKDPVTHRFVHAWKTHEPFNSYGLHWFYAEGVMLDAARLLESPDSEIVAGGMNLKGDDVVALGRDANLFFWGPPASPRDMTEEARRAFVNTIVYMKQFHGVHPTVWRGELVRSDVSKVLDFLGFMSRQVLNDKPQPGGGGGNQGKETISTSEKSIRSDIDVYFGPDLIKQFGYDVSAYRKFFDANKDYLYVPHGQRQLELDEDAKAIGIPNNDVKFLDKCIDLLGNPTEANRGRQLLERYTRMSFPDASSWKQWLDENRSNLYFSDYYDYRFYTGPAAPAPSSREVQQALWEMKGEKPLHVFKPVVVEASAVGYQLSHPGKRLGIDGKTVPLLHQEGAYETHRGALVTLVVRLNIANGNFTYAKALDKPDRELTKLSVDLPDGARWCGDWNMPKAVEGFELGTTEYRGDLVFTRNLYFASIPTEGRDSSDNVKITIHGNAYYQACYQANGTKCLKPQDTPFETSIIVADQ